MVGVQANLRTYLKHFQTEFKVGTFNQSDNAFEYIRGLLKGQTGKRNIEKISQQEISNPYQSLHHFISHSHWDIEQVNNVIQQLNQKLLKGKSYGYIIDERSQAKKGSHSVAVGRQYCGSTGKIDNCQTGVYAVLTTPSMTLPSNFRLFVPQEWITDKKRCRKAGLPSGLLPKTKVDLAIEMIKEDRNKGIFPLWYGGDSLYGRAWKLTNFIEEDCQSYFVMDTSKDHQIYLTNPLLDRKAQATTIEEYLKSICLSKRKIVNYEGNKKARVHVVEIFTKHTKCDRNRAPKRVLIISKGLAKNDKIKYSLTNFTLYQKTAAELVYMQRARFTVEQYFREANQIAGMGDYQVRSFKAWNHCQILSMMLMQLLNTIRISLLKKKALLSLITISRCAALILLKVGTYKKLVHNIIRQFQLNLNSS